MKFLLKTLFSLTLLFIFFCNSTIAQSKKADYEIFEDYPPIPRINKLLNSTDSLKASNQEMSLNYAELALELSTINSYDLGRLKALTHIADLYWSKSDLKQAIEYANQAKKLALQLGEKNEYAEVNYVVAKIYNDLGEYDKSSEQSFEALQIFESENNKKGKCKILNSIGYTYYEQGEFDKALEYYSRSLDVAREIKDSVGIAKGLNNVGAAYANKGEFEMFDSNIKEAIEINKKQGQLLNEGINYSNLGESNMARDNYDSAFYYYKKAELIFTELNNIPKLSFLYLSYSSYYSSTNESQKRIESAILALELGKKHALKRSVYQAASILHEAYVNDEDLENAYKYSLIESQYKDSLDLEQSLTKLTQLELAYEFEKANQERLLKQKQKEFQLIIYGLSLFFILVLVIILLLTRQRIRAKNQLIAKKQLELEIENKNKELTSNVMSLMRKNEVLSEIADKLMVIRNEAVKDETKLAIKRIAAELNKTSDQEIWKEFELRFKQVHSEFYNTLLSRFPNLSPNEERLCAFLRLNMTSKEISELTGQRIATLEIARSRLRKKLGITNTQTNLVIFLSQI